MKYPASPASAGMPLSKLFGHQERVLSVAVSPDGRRLASGSLDRTRPLLWEEKDALVLGKGGVDCHSFVIVWDPLPYLGRRRQGTNGRQRRQFLFKCELST